MTGAEFARSVREEWSRETGVPITLTHAWHIVEQLVEAWVERSQAIGIEEAVNWEPTTAEYVMNFWKGEDRKRLKAALIKMGRIAG